MSDQSLPVDVVGIGFGPSNLALAIAIEEHNVTAEPGQQVSARFFDKQERFGWHRGMLLPGSTMQVAFLKDLVSQRNPRSAYSFINYLHERGRLTDFINRQDFFPLRVEFHDYLAWAADRVDIEVHYGTEVTTVRHDDDAFVVEYAGGAVRARNIVLGGGLRAKLPAGVIAGPRVFHNHQVLDRFAELPELRHKRFAVIGAGQSAAEVAEFLHERTDAEVHAVYSKYGYTPADDSPYANRIFDPNAVDEYFSSEPAWRERLMHYHRYTNYSAVDPVLIKSLYNREYTERVLGERRFFVHGSTEITDIAATDDEVTVDVLQRMTGERTRLECDAVIFATGFEPLPMSAMLGELAEQCHSDQHGQPVLDRLYRVATDDTVPGQIFVQGNTEHSHGLTATLLSNVAIRSGEIVGALVDGPTSDPIDAVTPRTPSRAASGSA